MIGLLCIVFLCILVAIFAIGTAMDRRSSRAQILRERLQAVDTAAERHPSHGLDILRDELLSEIPVLNKLLGRWSRTSKLQMFMEQAGLRLRAGKFLLICACSAALAGCISLAFSGQVLLTLSASLICALLPFAIVSILRRRRFRRFEALFPQAIDLLVRSSRAGHPFTASLEMITTELAEPIAGEFRRIFEEQKYGLPLRDALLNLADRVPLLDVKFFVTTLTLQRETGGNLAEILDKLSYLIRERFRILRQVRVHTAQGRLTMIVLLSLPPATISFITLADPAYAKPLFHDPIGHSLIALGLGLQVIGFFLIRRIINIKV